MFWKPSPYHVRYKPGAHKTFLGGRGLTEDEAFQVWRQFFDKALEKYPAAIGYCWHPVYLAARKLALEERYYRTDSHFRQCVNYAKSRGAGLTGADAWNDFWRAREQVAIELVARNPALSTAQYRVPAGFGKDEYDYRNMAQRDDLDAVLVATGVQKFGRIATDVMKAGKHVATAMP